MARAYIEKLSSMLARAGIEETANTKFEVKHFFGGAALYANGEICVTLTKVGLALKLPEETRQDLMKNEGARPLQYFPQGPIKKEYALLPGRLINNNDSLRNWLTESIKYVTKNEKE